MFLCSAVPFVYHPPPLLVISIRFYVDLDLWEEYETRLYDEIGISRKKRG